MSYTYIKTVFPDFEFSNVYDDKLYKNQNELPKPVNILKETRVEKVEQVEPVIEGFKDNLKYYSEAVIDQHIPRYNNISVGIEGMENEIPDVSNVSHDQYINHIENCQECKDAILGKYCGQNEELMELASYILFGVLLYMLLKR